MNDPSIFIAGMALAAMAFIAGCIIGREFEADRWRRPADMNPGETVEVCHGEKRYRVRAVEPATDELILTTPGYDSVIQPAAAALTHQCPQGA